MCMPMPSIICCHGIGINADADADVWNGLLPQYVSIGISNDIKLHIGIGNCEMCMPMPMLSIIFWHSIGINADADAHVSNAFFPRYVSIRIGNDIKLHIGIGNCELCMPMSMLSIIHWHGIGINADSDADVWNGVFPQFVSIRIGNDINVIIGVSNRECGCRCRCCQLSFGTASASMPTPTPMFG